MSDYIATNHAGASGIVYCSSKEDVQKVADGLMEESKGAIRTAVYHRDVPAGTKARAHNQWQNGMVGAGRCMYTRVNLTIPKINVIVATIAFGMGIDKGNVRFVLHYSVRLTHYSLNISFN